MRPGGKWRYINRAGDREDVTFYGEYLEVDPPRGFKWTFMFDVDGMGPMGGPETFILEELGAKTKVTSIGHMGSVDVLEGALSTGMVAGGLETWDRLADLLAKSWQDRPPTQHEERPPGVGPGGSFAVRVWAIESSRKRQAAAQAAERDVPPGPRRCLQEMRPATKRSPHRARPPSEPCATRSIRRTVPIRARRGPSFVRPRISCKRV